MHVLQRQVLITRDGQQELMAEIAVLEGIRQDILDERRRTEPAVVGGAANEISAVENEIVRLRDLVRRATLVDDDALIVAIGSQVTVLGELSRATVTISGPLASNPQRGTISYESPLGRTLLGRELGDQVEFLSARGLQRLLIVDIRPAGQGASQDPRGSENLQRIA